MLDQIAIARTVTVAAGVFAPGHLGELTQLIPFEMVDAVLTATRRVQHRVRRLPARVVVYLILAGCLFAELGYPQVWRQLTAGLVGSPARRSSLARAARGDRLDPDRRQSAVGSVARRKGPDRHPGSEADDRRSARMPAGAERGQR